MNKILLISFFLFFNCVYSQAQPADRRITREEYIEKYKDDAIREMMKSGVPASITLAQGILESGDGNSPLAIYAKNHFGVKCHKGWTGESMRLDDDEKNECFRKYESVYESFSDHSDFLVTRSRYDFLFDLKITDYKGWAKGLKKAGYATNPKYADLLIMLIEKNDLSRYDNYAKVPPRKITKKRSPKALATKNFRTIKLHNRIKYIRAKKGDTFYKITQDFDMNLWQVFKYNDLNKSDILKVGDIIYLQPKRNKGREKLHVVKKGETMRGISQLYGVKLKKLYKKNKMFVGTQPNVGDEIILK
ncbi:MAG: glucosaminidase domain-containing protein [Flavobacteriales bacterium]|nr:glucosaminidase domain-containing protein [Flavobacteriales bacterium]